MNLKTNSPGGGPGEVRTDAGGVASHSQPTTPPAQCQLLARVYAQLLAWRAERLASDYATKREASHAR